MYRGECIGYVASRQIRRLSLLLKPQYHPLLTGLLQFSVFLSDDTFKEQRMWLLCPSQSKPNANKRQSILVQFPPYLRRRLTSLYDRQAVHHGCYGNCSSSGFAVAINVLLYKQSERAAQSVRDVKLRGQMRLDGLNTFSPKGYVWAKTKQQLFWHKTYF